MIHKLILPLLIAVSLVGIVNKSNATNFTDGQIIAIYNQVNSFDIESAGLAISKASSIKVKKLAQMVAKDHRGVRLMAGELADDINAIVSLPVARHGASMEFYNKIIELSKLSGTKFDKAYLLYEIDFHTQAIKAVKTVLLPKTNNAKLIEHFNVVLPHFEKHLNETTKIAKSLGYL